ncbi:MAG TPA: hypothetical protein VJ124_03990 [Pyrinomonadaceae bacterium]|nr:hypothetical protein [Pyrinomonadaceae bacterium]
MRICFFLIFLLSFGVYQGDVASGQQRTQQDRFLLVWAGDADRQQEDFLAVIDVRSGSPTFGHVIATVPVGSKGNEPHHSMTPSQKSVGGDPAPGGLLEFDKRGTLLRRISAQDPQAGDAEISPYGLALKIDVDRMVTTNSGHGWLPSMNKMTDGYTVQLWRVSDLKLLRTMKFPTGPRGDENVAPYEPRFAHARDSQTVFINTVVGSALYVSTDVAAANPKFHLIYDFGKDSAPGYPLLSHDDRYYLQPLTSANKIIVLDVRDPLHPKLISEIRFDRDPVDATQTRVGQPHYLVLDRAERRAGVSNYTLDLPSFVADGDRRLYLLEFDRRTGELRFDQTFRDELTGAVGVDFNREVWLHGKTGAARPHGMIFLP